MPCDNQSKSGTNFANELTINDELFLVYFYEPVMKFVFWLTELIKLVEYILFSPKAMVLYFRR